MIPRNCQMIPRNRQMIPRNCQMIPRNRHVRLTEKRQCQESAAIWHQECSIGIPTVQHRYTDCISQLYKLIQLYIEKTDLVPCQKDRNVTSKETGRKHTTAGWSPTREGVVNIKPTSVSSVQACLTNSIKQSQNQRFCATSTDKKNRQALGLTPKTCRLLFVLSLNLELQKKD